jgi:surfactin synthase thioesterase subunit
MRNEKGQNHEMTKNWMNCTKKHFSWIFLYVLHFFSIWKQNNKVKVIEKGVKKELR